MMTTHIPGTWAVEGRHITAKSARWGQSTGIVLIAKLERHRIGSSDRVPPDEVQEANARLMAASPALLAAAELAIEYLSHPDVQAMPFALPASRPVELLRAAINAAKGEA